MIEKIASEGLKPFSSLIDSLIAPKIQRIKLWAEKREIQNKVASSSIDKLLEKYLQRLIRRISGITTIAFPQQILPLTSIYEPLFLTNLHNHPQIRRKRLKKIFDVDTLMDGKNYLIIDSAGMGKSTFAKHLVLKILDATDKIPIFLELRRISESETLLQKIASEIDSTKKEINEELLLRILEQGGFIIVLDGYDEISDQFREEIGKQIFELAIQCEENSVILTSRPETNLPELPESSHLTIIPLNKIQAQSLLLKYDDAAKIDVGKRLISELDNVKEEFLNTPLLVVLLYRTYGFNQSIANRISSFYDEVYNALYKGHDLTKSGFSRPKLSKLDSEDFRKLLRGFSFLLRVRRKDNLKSQSEAIQFIDEAIKLTKITPTSSSNFLDDLLLSVPFLIKDGTEFRFIHKSFGEFFSAEFLSYYPNNKQLIENINKSESAESFVNTFDFLSEINSDLFRNMIVLPLAAEILDKIEKYPEIILTTHLISNCSIGLWDANKYLDAIENDEEIGLPEKYDNSTYTYGILNDKDYILASSYKRIKKFPSTIWKYISKFNKFDLNAIHLEKHNYNQLIDFPVNEWIDIEDEIIIKNVNIEVIKNLLRDVIASEQTIASVKNYTSTAIIDEKLCREVIQKIEIENKTQDWLESLIS